VDKDLILLFKLRVGIVIVELIEDVDMQGGDVAALIEALKAELLVLTAFMHREYAGSDGAYKALAHTALALAERAEDARRRSISSSRCWPPCRWLAR
jgi:hypothetical protein